MSESPAETASNPSTGPDSRKGFRAFWRKHEETAAERHLTFVQQDPLKKKKQTNRLSRLLKQSSSPEAGDGESHQSDAKKRRQQIYQAQKRHRNRKASYVESLEKEVARLQRLDAQANHDKNALALENQAIRDFLTKQAIEVQLDSLDLTPNASALSPNDLLNPLEGPTLDVRYDADISHERTFLDSEDLLSTSSTAPPTTTSRHAPVQGDSSAALDFILALEWPCQAHTPHDGLNPDAGVMACDAEDLGEAHGHALTATNAVYQSAVPLGQTSAQKWHLPHSEIDKLVELSQKLPLDDEQLTPAQAYSAIRETIASDAWLRPTLEAIKKPLARLAQCTGFGTFLPADLFWRHLHNTMRMLEATRPDLNHLAGSNGVSRET